MTMTAKMRSHRRYSVSHALSSSTLHVLPVRGTLAAMDAPNTAANGTRRRK